MDKLKKLIAQAEALAEAARALRPANAYTGSAAAAFSNGADSLRNELVRAANEGHAKEQPATAS